MIQMTASERTMIVYILEYNLPDTTVWAYGPRVDGTSTKFSDLNLLVISKEPITDLSIFKLKTVFSNTDLPYKVNIVDWNSLSSEEQRNILNISEKLV